jgi:hypothetical protein
MTEKNSLSSYNEIKQLIADPKFRIRLYDHIWGASEVLMTKTAEEFFPLIPKIDSGEFASRLKRYEDASGDLTVAMFLIGLWGTLDHQLSIAIPAIQFSRQLGENVRSNKLSSLRLYPLVLLMYALGVGAVTSNNYSLLYTVLHSDLGIFPYPQKSAPLVYSIEEGFRPARELFNSLSEHNKDSSEYIFDLLNNRLKDIFLLGSDYEDVFDRFEIIYALEYAHERLKISGNVWAPTGRSGWKYSRGVEPNPFSVLCDEASREKASWILLETGFFDGSYERFEQIAKQYAQVLRNY